MRRTPTAPLLLAALLASACAHREVRTIGDHRPGDPTWPRGDKRRIAWVGEIRGPENVGIERGFFTRVWDFVSGRRQLEGLYRPYGVAVDGTGRIAVADPGRRTVHLYDPAKGTSRRLHGAAGAPLVYPVAVAFLGRTLLVADSEAHAVRAFDENGKAAALPVALPALTRPSALAVDEARGRLFVVDTAEHVVHVLPLAPGGEARVLGGRGAEPGRFNFPTHVALDAEGRLAVTDAMNFRVQLFDAALEPMTAFGQLGDGLGDLPRPKGIVVDREGVVFVLEGYFDVIQAFDAKGTLLGAFGGSGVEPGRLWLAGGMALDARGRLYVADTFNARVQVFDLEARTP
jgi:DNA-binding beta-propeller fold protein YncE